MDTFSSKETVHVEAVVKDSARLLLMPGNLESLQSDIVEALSSQTAFQNGLIPLGTSPLASVLESLRVSDLPTGFVVDAATAELCVHPFVLFHGDPEKEYLEGDEEVCASEQWSLPHAAIVPLWDSIIADENVKARLLGYCASAMQFAARCVDPTIISWNRMALLYGPPGTGKTTLCKALAQKVFVQSTGCYDSGVLVEINTHSLFSRYFSESGKLVLKLFEYVDELCRDPRAFVAVLIDEVESLVMTRAAGGGEPADAVRVVNAVLTCLDALKRRPNALVLCTSNLAEGIDPAFRDRCDLAMLIDNPSWAARAKILSSCLQELVGRDFIATPAPGESIIAQLSGSRPVAQDFTEVLRLSAGLSGRQLRKSPLQAHAFFIQRPRAPLADFVGALRRIMEERVGAPVGTEVESADTATLLLPETANKTLRPTPPAARASPAKPSARVEKASGGAGVTGGYGMYNLRLQAFMQDVTLRGLPLPSASPLQRAMHVDGNTSGSDSDGELDGQE